MIHARHSAVVVLTLSAVGLLAPVGAQVQPGNLPAANGQPRYVDGEVLVHYKPGTTLADRQSAGLAAGAIDVQALGASGSACGGSPLGRDPGCGCDRAPATRRPRADRGAQLDLPASGHVERSTVSRRIAVGHVRRHIDSSEPVRQSGGRGLGPRTSPDRARCMSRSSTKASISTIQTSPRTSGPIRSTRSNGVDNDGNGRIDDIHGWDFVSNDNSDLRRRRATITARTSPAPSARVGGNGIGVAGVNWNVTLIIGQVPRPERRHVGERRRRRSTTSPT